MDSALDPRLNLLLAALPPGEYRRIEPKLELCLLPLGTVLYEPFVVMKHAYFPLDAIVSLLCVTRNGGSAEISVVGREGVVGVSLFMGGGSTSSRALVQARGHAYRLPARVVSEEFRRGGAMQVLFLRYIQALLTQMAQTAVCNRHHNLDQQLCRWLLLSHDRIGGDELIMTQELIANMLGVRREGVTEAAGKLQKAGLIRYRRGHIDILSRAGLEARSCECYEVVRREYDRLLTPVLGSAASSGTA